MLRARFAAAVVVCSLTAATATAQTAQPTSGAPALRITNANFRTVAVSGSLTSQFRALVEQQVEPAWIAYSQPINDSTYNGCCWGWYSDGRGCCAGCPLESRQGITSITHDGGEARAPSGAIKLEGATEVAVLFRIEQKSVDRVRLFSADCELDAGGRVVHVLTGVRPADSVALLESLVTGSVAGDRKGGTDTLISGIALTKDPSADAALGRLVAPTQAESIRRRAMFWFARARGRSGFEAVRKMLREDPSLSMRKEAVGALAQSREAEVVPLLIDTARSNPDADVRGQALFWLAQKAGRQAEDTLTRAVAEDPETKVKERAVFAISQLPKDRSIPLLIDVARTNKNPAVRKKAMFWLGESRDPRAVAFFESILTR